MEYNSWGWDGTPIIDGVSIVLRTTQYDVGTNSDYRGRVELAAPIGIMPWRWNEGVPTYDYVTAEASGPRAGAVFTVRTWPRVDRECMPNNSPRIYQKIILRAPGGAYLTTDWSGYYHASADEAGASVFCLDLTRGAQTILYHMFYRYGQRTEIDPFLSTLGSRGSFTARFAQPSPQQPILLGFEQGIGDSAVIDIEMMHPTGRTLPDGIRLRDRSDGAVFVTLEGAMRHIPNPATYANLYRSDLVPTDIAPGYAYSVSRPLTDGAYLARGGDGRLFLMSDGLKRWIGGPAVFERFEFDWNKVRDVPAEVLDAVPESATIV
ncbi:MAG TPA: hypothetical protein VN231_15150 [Allosphingosinicella sp.]|nr:hypothetical protein [Allosphingosinicella sp.]